MRRLEAQIEKGLIIQVCRPLRDPRVPMTMENLINLIMFAVAAALFDEVYMPCRVGRGPLPLQLIPKAMMPGVFRTEEVPDARQRMKRARDKSIRLAKSVVAGPGMHRLSDGEIQLEFVRRTMVSWGEGWYDALMRDSESILETCCSYEQEAVERALSNFDGPGYTGLTDAEKIAIFHLWRCWYNMELSIEYDRVWLHNEVRSPMIEAVIHAMSKENPSPNILPPDLGTVMCGDNHGHRHGNWRQATFALLYKVLKAADCNREKIPEAIMSWRLSGPCVRFREHVRRIRQTTTASGVTKALEEDAKHALQLWSTLSSIGQESTLLVPDVMKVDPAAVAQILMHIRVLPYLFYCRYMSVIWQRQDGKFHRELEGIIVRTFPELRGISIATAL